jgi:hypothetical protein
MAQPHEQTQAILAAIQAQFDQWHQTAEPLGSGARVDKGTQILLREKYRELLRTGAPLPAIDEVGFRSFSQYDEDGILLYLFSLLGTTNRRCIEVCAGVGYESCTANLIIHHAWEGLMFDGSEENIKKAWNFFSRRPDTLITVPKLVPAWIEPERINDLILEQGYRDEIDLLVIDMDGIDYWVWQAISIVQPRVVVVEYQPWFRADEPYTIPYRPSFAYSDSKKGYVGCSLAAYVNLAREKGYRLVGCNRNHLNAFFVRNDLGTAVLPTVDAASCLKSRRIEEMIAWIRPFVDTQLANGEWQKV